MSQFSDRRSGLTLILWLLSAAALIGLLLFCTSCSAQEPAPTQPSASFEISVLADQGAYDLNAVLQDFYQTNHNLPAALASTMSAFPSRVEACGVSTSDPVELTEVLYYSEHGGDIQKNTSRRTAQSVRRSEHSLPLRRDYRCCSDYAGAHGRRRRSRQSGDGAVLE